MGQGPEGTWALGREALLHAPRGARGGGTHLPNPTLYRPGGGGTILAVATDIEYNLEGTLGPDHVQAIISSVSDAEDNRPSETKPTHISKLRIIQETLAEGVPRSNTKFMRNKSDNVLSIHFTKNHKMLRYRRIQSTLFSNTMFVTPKSNSTRGNTCLQLFISDNVFVATYPMISQEEFEMALICFFKYIGVPLNRIVDAHQSQISI